MSTMENWASHHNLSVLLYSIREFSVCGGTDFSSLKRNKAFEVGYWIYDPHVLPLILFSLLCASESLIKMNTRKSQCH